jgi:hypothetical protein
VNPVGIVFVVGPPAGAAPGFHGIAPQFAVEVERLAGMDDFHNRK